MTNSNPPRLAVALLRRFVHDNEPLAGDLLERFAAGRSRLWFWRQVLLAIAIRSLQRRADDRPLGLAGHSSVVSAGLARTVERPRRINVTASPLPGVSGLGLVLLIAVAGPQVLWIFLPAILGGVAIGVTMALVRRRAVLSGPAAASRILLRDGDRKNV